MTDDLDALRHFDEEDNFDFDDDADYSFDAPTGEPQRFLGMTAVERMFLSIFLFLNVVVIGMALLIATGRIRF